MTKTIAGTSPGGLGGLISHVMASSILAPASMVIDCPKCEFSGKDKDFYKTASNECSCPQCGNEFVIKDDGVSEEDPEPESYLEAA